MPASNITFRDYYELCKPRVVALMLLTAVVGMFLATPGMVPLSTLVFATVGIGLAGGAAAVVNHLVDRHIDTLMARTRKRPIAAGRVPPRYAIVYAIVLTVIAMALMVTLVNTLTAVLTLATLIGYAGVYTMYLKRATPQNIVIGGLAGAAPPLLGWTAVTGNVDPHSLLLVLIIFTWTPPHFWALAVHRCQDYERAEIPMLPVTHGIPFTKRCILLYSMLLFAVSVLPFATHMSGVVYLLTATLLGVRFCYLALSLYRDQDNTCAMKLFKFSITYLGLLFVGMLIDHYLIT